MLIIFMVMMVLMYLLIEIRGIGKKFRQDIKENKNVA